MIDVPVRVKDALRDGRLKKNYRIEVLYSDESVDFTISNSNLVAESVSIDERMASGDTIKFGLCEGSSLEFQYFGLPSILDRRLRVYVDVSYIAKSKDFVETEEDTRHPYNVQKAGIYHFKSKDNIATNIGVSEGGYNTYYSLSSSNNYQRDLLLTTSQSFWVDDENVTVTVTAPGGFEDSYPIPMGYYTVSKISRQASTGIIKVTAYNKLQSKYLDEKANSRIVDIVDHGVIGVTDGVDVGTILDELLGDYAIKREERAVPFSVVSQQIPSSDTSSIRHTDMTGSSNGVFIHTLDITDYVEPQGFLSSNFYRFRINFKNIFDAIYSYVDEYYLDQWFKSTTQSSNIDRLYRWLEGTTSFPDSLYVGGFQIKTTAGIEDYSIQEYRTVNNFISPWFTNVDYMLFGITGLFELDNAQTRNWTQAEIDLAKERLTDLLFTQGNFSIEISSRSEIEKTIISKQEAQALKDVTLRDLQTAVFESQCQFGNLDRITDLFAGTELNKSRLYPAEYLYPANSLYPDGAANSANKSMYSRLWADEGNVQSFRYLIITYLTIEDNKQVEKTIQRTVNSNGTQDYNCSDNWLFKNLVWSISEIEDFADEMALKMQGVKWFPFEMWCAGLPYLETGDEIEIPMGEETYTSYILQRGLKGIQNLQDTFINGTLDIF